MTTVGVRELRQRASELLRRVEAGEVFEVTDRGRPVAVLGPLPPGAALDRLRASGDVTLRRGRRVLPPIELARVSDRVIEAAGVLLPAELRSLDAIHLASAAQLRDSLARIVTYDERMAAAAAAAGFTVAAPA